MSGRVQTRVALLTALVALVAVLVPAGLAMGSHEPGDAVGGEPSWVLLTLGQQDKVTFGADTQAITTNKYKCTDVAFAANPQILKVTAIGGQLGEVKDGLGVRNKWDIFGLSCGRVDAGKGEALSVALGSHTTLDGMVMTAIDVDLEVTSKGQVKIRFLHDGVEVASEVFAPPSSHWGHDANHRYVFNPAEPVFFDEVVFSALKGSFSLEGGANAAGNGSLDPNPNKSSQFQVASLFDGEITCGDTVTIDSEDVDEVVGVVTMQALKLNPEGGFDTACEELKNFNEEVTEESLLFAPVLVNAQARYTLELTIENQPITTDSEGRIDSLLMVYDDGSEGAEERPLQACLGQPNPSIMDDPDTGLLPMGEFACHFRAGVTPTGSVDGLAVGTETWSIYFEDDPKFRFR